MTQEQILEGNKLIAEFMGYEKYKGYYIHPDSSSATQMLTDEIMKYHTSWDWLMPVVEKIEELGYVTTLNGLWNKNYTYSFLITDISNNTIVYGKGVSDLKKIDAVYSAVNYFIKWYNKNTEQ